MKLDVDSIKNDQLELKSINYLYNITQNRKADPELKQKSTFILLKKELIDHNNRVKFLNIKEGTELAQIFDIPYTKFLYTLHLLSNKPNSPLYTEFEIQKRSGGKRKISAPNKYLLSIQQKLNYFLSLIYIPPKSVHGFIKSQVLNDKMVMRNIITNAIQHSNRKIILNIDLKDFFPSITGKRIYKLFTSYPFNFDKSVAGLITRACIHPDWDCLPQGAATSPIISNMIARQMDRELILLAAKYKMVYTRYADDITFSTNKRKLPEDLQTEIDKIIIKQGFNINDKKIRIQGYSVRQEVTGLIVNKKVNVHRKYIRNVRSMLKNWEIKGLQQCQIDLIGKYKRQTLNQNHDFRNILLGRIEFIGNVRGKTIEQDPWGIYKKLIDQFNRLSGKLSLRNNEIVFDNNAEYQSEIKKIIDQIN